MSSMNADSSENRRRDAAMKTAERDIPPIESTFAQADAEASYPLPDDLPDAPPAPRASMGAAEALERLARGETLRDVRIDRLVFRGEFPGPVRMRNVVLVQPTFEKVGFAAEVKFEHCTIDRPRFNRNVTCAGDLDLRGSTLVKPMLRGLVVQGSLRCDNIRCRGRFLLASSRFNGPVRFWEARFEGWASFEGVTFADQADFRSVHADEGFVLKDCRFLNDFLFRGSSVSKKWDANGSRFEGLLDLSKAKLHDFVYLEGIEQGSDQRFAFQNAITERMLIRTEQLAGRLASEETGDHECAAREYALLKRVFEAAHRYEQEDWAFYRFKINQRLCCVRSWRRPWTKLNQFLNWVFLDIGCAYGTSPFRAVTAAAVMILAFALVYMVGIDGLHIDRVPFSGEPSTLPNRILIGLQTSVAAFTSGFGDLRDTGRGLMSLPLIAESLLGTLLWGLFIVAFSRKVIR
jgi:hypothetical protein